jgi:hypothetical protein
LHSISDVQDQKQRTSIEIRNEKVSQAWWQKTVTPAIRRQRQDCYFEGSLGYTVKILSKKAETEQTRNDKVK